MTDSPAKPYAEPARQHFPSDEQRQPWLGMLLDAYFCVDRGIAEAVSREEARSRCLACSKGCAHCCRSHLAIPVYPLELVGISWYAVEKLAEPARGALIARLRSQRPDQGCPFLLGEICSIHPMRPMACRQFNVFDQVCAPGEDAYYTRRQDVLPPQKRVIDEAFDITLPFYGVKQEAERRQVIKSGAVHRMAKVLGELRWLSLAAKMEAFAPVRSED